MLEVQHEKFNQKVGKSWHKELYGRGICNGIKPN